MAKGTFFGNVHSNTDLHLIQQSVHIKPAVPHIKRVEVPGADGSVDLSDAFGIGMSYGDREISWTFALYPGDNWYQKQTQVSNAINGVLCNIVLDDETGYYYSGRVSVEDYTSDKLLHQITVKAVCAPYKLKSALTTVSQNLTTSYKTITLANEMRPVCPQIVVSVASSLQFGPSVFAVNAGTHVIGGIRLLKGNNTLKAKTNSGSGTIQISYREGSL